ncbi:hypothetical protein DLAC_02642 [Tieghemostelium lacteum]|uniref:Pentacotripeptide-repeat region of PRORP domain-containing protein n=1 Tax=Tieghemostelium lacteum TaxID=361077 RepID=A0A152A2Z8_TIELA|nr:hypothetical protein DLAC_02642 [Tieghemostelium lacteum]|eukprot:KYR00618.1 hypothetical protein DLAC_02642 [Tieghemostelium lacteum]
MQFYSIVNQNNSDNNNNIEIEIFNDKDKSTATKIVIDGNSEIIVNNEKTIDIPQQLFPVDVPINPFDYSVKTVDDALQLRDIKPVGIDSPYITGAMHQSLKESMPLLRNLIEQDQMESSFALFQVMERFYVPVAEECYQQLRVKIEEAIVEIARFNRAMKQEELAPGSVPENQLALPKVETVNTLLNYYTETDKLPEAFRLFTTMKYLGIQPNKHTYRSLINASLRYEDIDVALLAFENMRLDEIVLEEQTYERLFESCCNTVHYDGATVLYHELINNFKIPTVNRLAYATTLGITRLMNWVKLPKSVRSGRGYVTSLRISPTKFIFPPKTDNHIMLEPRISPKELLHLSNKDGGDGLLPFI